METLEKDKHHDDASRMRLRGLVKLASERTATTWPMHTFISRNPLHDLEHLDFNEALLQAKRHMGGEGYLSNLNYRSYFKTGRISETQLDAALRSIVSEKKVILDGREISHLEVLRAHFTHGCSPPSQEILETVIQNDPAGSSIETLAERISPFVISVDLHQKITHFAGDYHAGLSRCLTLSAWFDHVFDTRLTQQINDEMIKWCVPFLDEGQAPWPLPFREKGLYVSWRRLAAQEWSFGGIVNIREKIKKAPERPADMLLENLETLGIPEDAYEDYLGLHLTALPGWTALMKWRAEHQDYAWQQAAPIDLVQYLAIRLWYEREWIETMCREKMGIKGTLADLLNYISCHPKELFLRRERTGNLLPTFYAEAVDHLSHRLLKSKDLSWETLADEYVNTSASEQTKRASLSVAWSLTALSKKLCISAETLSQSPLENLKQLMSWIDATPERNHGPIWLEAFEAGYQETLLIKLKSNLNPIEPEEDESPKKERPLAQAVFCLDVRSESFRRHLEKMGHETFGFAGFFTVFIRYLAFDRHHETNLFPAITKVKNVVKEIPRPFQEKKVPRYHAGAAFIHAAHTLFHDLKENVITPYVMVESVGWFFGLPLMGKTLFPLTYQRGARWLKNLLAPPLATTLTIDKLTRETVYKMIASEQRMTIKEALRAQPERDGKTAKPESIEALRKWALHGGAPSESLDETEEAQVALLFESSEQKETFVQRIREEHFITEAWASARMERITRTGFTINEQIFAVKTALKMMGLTKNFAKLILFCGHGSTSDNNPYEAALDCGACSGNPGHANARVLAALANKTHVREHLKKEDILIPEDTHFIAGHHDTATDEVTIHDLEDLPPTHKNALGELILDLKHAGKNNSRERCRHFSDLPHALTNQGSALGVLRRSADWSQTRPEWGLSGNAAIVISKGKLIKGIDLNGRVFLHSYDQEQDPTGQFLEIILTGPQVVAQWINMEYYFSTTDNTVYGSGSKIYHNVAGRIGVMYGATSDLLMGLPSQTVYNGKLPYHEPMRLFTIIEAPRDRIQKIISRHRVLQDHFNHRWVHLVALEERRFYRYIPKGTWREETP